MKYGPCADCKESHKCGVECTAKKCFDAKCSCAAKEKEIAHGLFQCDNCQLLIPNNAKAFENYFEDAVKWYDDFCLKHKTWLYDLEKSHLSGKLMGEKEVSTYEIIQAFCAAKSNISQGIPLTIQLDTISSRINAYAFVKAFEALKSIEFEQPSSFIAD